MESLNKFLYAISTLVFLRAQCILIQLLLKGIHSFNAFSTKHVGIQFFVIHGLQPHWESFICFDSPLSSLVCFQSPLSYFVSFHPVVNCHLLIYLSPSCQLLFSIFLGTFWLFKVPLLFYWFWKSEEFSSHLLIIHPAVSPERIPCIPGILQTSNHKTMTTTS